MKDVLNTSTTWSFQYEGWCQIAYWELMRRIGPLFRVISNSIDIFHDSPQCGGGGLSLQALAYSSGRASAGTEQHRADNDRSNQLRTRIGLGVSLHREADGTVWVHNRSDIVVFVSSCFLSPVTAKAAAAAAQNKDRCIVFKLLPGSCIMVYDLATGCADERDPLHVAALAGCPVDQCSVHLSFAKGWGHGYTRQTITSCSCWLEILLCKATAT